MARIVGGVTTSHIPAIGNAMTDGKENDPYWKRFFDGYEPVKEWLAKVDPDIAIVVYNDHGLNFFLDTVPTFALGRALRKAIESYPEDKKVVIFGTGGMSHQLQGERAGHINVEFDLQCMESIIDDPEWLAGLGNTEIIEKAGTEGIEVIMWLVMRGALQEKVNVVHKHYHVPVSNTGAGVLVLENPD